MSDLTELVVWCPACGHRGSLNSFDVLGADPGFVFCPKCVSHVEAIYQTDTVMPLDPTKIKARRERLGLSQREAAERAGMPQPHWARLEAGNRSDPQLSTAEAVAKALRCSLPRLLAD